MARGALACSRAKACSGTACPTALLTEVCRVYNDWITDFCKPYPEGLEGIAMLNVDDVDEACLELERSKKLGLVGAFISVSPVPDKPCRHPIYERLWWTAQDLDMPLCCISAHRVTASPVTNSRSIPRI
jgi:predicted TIM-barrel fold metal-dependent hydrolase